MPASTDILIPSDSQVIEALIGLANTDASAATGMTMMSDGAATHHFLHESSYIVVREAFANETPTGAIEMTQMLLEDIVRLTVRLTGNNSALYFAGDDTVSAQAALAETTLTIGTIGQEDVLGGRAAKEQLALRGRMEAFAPALNFIRSFVQAAVLAGVPVDIVYTAPAK